MKTVEKLLLKIASAFASVEQLADQATLIRISNIRILILNFYSGANNALTIPEADRPSENTRAPLYRCDSNYRSTAVGYFGVNHDNGYVQKYYGGTYNGSGSGASNVGSTDKVAGISIWTIGGGYGLTSILSRLAERWWKYEDGAEPTRYDSWKAEQLLHDSYIHRFATNDCSGKCGDEGKHTGGLGSSKWLQSDWSHSEVYWFISMLCIQLRNKFRPGNRVPNQEYIECTGKDFATISNHLRERIAGNLPEGRCAA